MARALNLEPSSMSVVFCVLDSTRTSELLLVQDGKLYGREPMFAVICKAALLPDGAKNHDIQKNKTVAQIGQLLITLLRVLCANTTWQRRKLGMILQDWRIIYVQVCFKFCFYIRHINEFQFQGSSRK
ncbi:hypothetical protein ACS0TY_011559 [Phlomoides rotata]